MEDGAGRSFAEEAAGMRGCERGSISTREDVGEESEWEKFQREREKKSKEAASRMTDERSAQKNKTHKLHGSSAHNCDPTKTLL